MVVENGRTAARRCKLVCRNRKICMGLSRRLFIEAAGAFGAGQAIGSATEARASVQPNRYRILWVAAKANEDLRGTRAYSLSNNGQLSGDYGNSAKGHTAPFLFRPNLDFTAGEFIPLETFLPPTASRLILSGPAAINDAGVLAGGAFRRVRGVAVNFAYRLHPPSPFEATWRLEKGPDLDSGCEATEVRLSNAGDVVFCTTSPGFEGTKSGTRLTAWLPGASNYTDLNAGRLVNDGMRPIGCCRVGNTLMMGVSGVDSGSVRGHRLDYDVVTGEREFHRLPNAAVQPGALGMNARGEVVGCYLTQVTRGVVERGFQRTADPWTLTLGTFGGERSAAYSINSNRDMVGHADYLTDRGSKSRITAFLCKGCRMWELAPLIEGGAPASLSTAQLLINDQGLIAGNVDGPYAAARADDRAFILVPSH